MTSTKDRIVQAGLLAASQVGYMRVTGEIVAQRADVTRALVQYYFPNMELFRCTLLREATKNEDIPILAQALGMRHEVALAMEPGLVRRVLEYIKTGTEAPIT